MKAVSIAAFLTLLVTACVDETAPKEAETAAEGVEKNAEQDAIKERQLSIEEAAEKATKLIEADAKAEIEASVDKNPEN